MLINHDITALRICNNISRLTSYTSKLMLQISSGQRINSAADDPAGLAISEKMRAQIRGLNQASRNAQDAISYMQTAEGALNENHSILQRVRELIVQASNGTYNSDDRKNIQQEIDQLLNEVDAISNDTEFNTIKVFGKNNKEQSLTIQIGPNSGQSTLISIRDMSSSALGISNITIVDKSSDEISKYLDSLDKAIGSVSSQRSGIGASINMLESRINYLDSTAENLQAAESRIRDVDIAKAIMEYAKNDILLKVSYALLAQANQSRDNMIKLLFNIKDTD